MGGDQGDHKGNALGEALSRFGRRLFPRREVFRDITGEVFDDGAAGVAEKRAREWSLVLSARGVTHRLFQDGDIWRIGVPGRLADRAVDEIRAYVSENARRGGGPPPVPRPVPARSVAWVMAGIGFSFVFLVSNPVIWGRRLDFVRLGVGDTAAMLFSGQWWRAVTALTLHADGAHLLGNVVVGGLFMAFLCRETGVGAGFFLALLAGAGGNCLKALIEGPGHHFLGASTAVFGALGVLGGLVSVSRARGLSWRRVAPFGAGLMLLALLGAGEEDAAGKIDLGGHFLGFAFGAALGAALGAARRRGWHVAAYGLNQALGCLAVAGVVAAWVSALLGWRWF